jgi:GNAT superfamily N-acetyltransferase
LVVAKIHALAVHPDRQRKGYGTLLMRDAVNIARCGEMAMLYGQFGPQRNLRPFYSSLGFDVLSQGEPLNVTMATGQANDYIACPPTETFIVKIFAR